MRAPVIILAGIVATASVAAVNSVRAGPTTDQATSSGEPGTNQGKYSGKFRKTAVRTPILRARAAARRGENGPAASSAPPSEGTIRAAAATARKRPAKPQEQTRADPSMPQPER